MNDFKPLKGVSGQVLASDTSSGVAGAPLQLYRFSTDEIVDVGVTDEDGSYTMDYKHTGPQDVYQVILPGHGMDQMIQLKGGGWAAVSFDVDTGTDQRRLGDHGQGQQEEALIEASRAPAEA